MIYRETDNGRAIPAKVDERILIELEENPTTGYLWETGVVAPEEPKAVWLSNEYLPSKPITVGSGGVRRITAQPKKTGCFTLSFHLKRSWETASLKTFQVTLRVGR
jgi:inhibitor of cysteine peptidase